jgi:guanylate kinase
MTNGVILYGPPAAGKDTVTRALGNIDSRYRLFHRIKVGAGRADGYRMATAAEVDRLRAAGEILWENRRYGATYVVDREHLAHELTEARPVLHLGQSKAIPAILGAFPAGCWLVVYLWCARTVAERRVVARDTGDVAQRMQAWDATEAIRADLMIDTGETAADEAAAMINAAVGDEGRPCHACHSCHRRHPMCPELRKCE